MEQKIKVYTGDENAINREIRGENVNGWTVKQISTSSVTTGNGWFINVVVLYEKLR